MSVGIIGGADGPTAVFVGSPPDIAWPIAGAVLICAAAVVFIVRRKRR